MNVNFLTKPPEFIIEEKQLKAQFKEQVLLLCDMRPKIGRPAITIYGNTERKQVTLDVATEIVGLLIDNLRTKGGVLDKKSIDLLTPRGRKHWATAQLNTMARFNPFAVGGNDTEAFWRGVGDLIPVGKSPRKQNVYIRAKGASPMEVDNFVAFLKGKGKKQAIRNAAGLRLAQNGRIAMGNRTLEEAYAQECEKYRSDNMPDS